MGRSTVGDRALIFWRVLTEHILHTTTLDTIATLVATFVATESWRRQSLASPYVKLQAPPPSSSSSDACVAKHGAKSMVAIPELPEPRAGRPHLM